MYNNSQRLYVVAVCINTIVTVEQRLYEKKKKEIISLNFPFVKQCLGTRKTFQCSHTHILYILMISDVTRLNGTLSEK